MEKKEVPKSVIIILLVLTVIISVLGTWTVLDELEKVAISSKPNSATGNVRLDINNPNNENPINDVNSFGEGKISLRILEAK